MATHKQGEPRLRAAVTKLTMSSSEKALLSKAAQHAGLPLASYIRASAIRHAKDDVKS